MKRKNQYVKKLTIFVLCINLLCTTTPVYPQQSVLREKAYTFTKDFALGGLATVGSFAVSMVLSNIYFFCTKSTGRNNNQTNDNVSQKTKDTSQKIIVAAGALGVRLLIKLTYDLASKGPKSLCTKEYIRNLISNTFGLAGFISSNSIDTMLLGVGLGNAIGGFAADHALPKQVQENAH